MKHFALAFVVTIGLFAAAIPAEALDRRVVIHNNSHQTMTFLYGSHVDTNDWEDDIFGDSVLDPHDSVRVDFNDNSGYCKFDIKAIWADGNVAFAMGQNICELTDLTFNN